MVWTQLTDHLEVLYGAVAALCVLAGAVLLRLA